MNLRYASFARWTSCLFFACLLVVIPSWAWADSGRPPDVVRLKNGGMVRGTILEAIPGEAVRVQLSDGNVREFPADTVDYAGPDSSPETAPRQEAPASPAAPTGATAPR